MRIVVNSRADDAIGDAVEALMRTKVGPTIKRNAQRIVPIKTGDLRDSIVDQTERTATHVVTQVGVDQDIRGVDYGDFVEEGTSRQAAQPYLVPAALQAKGNIR